MAKLIRKYYERLKIGITMSNMWNSLQTKSEVGLDKSEKSQDLFVFFLLDAVLTLLTRVGFAL